MSWHRRADRRMLDTSPDHALKRMIGQRQFAAPRESATAVSPTRSFANRHRRLAAAPTLWKSG